MEKKSPKLELVVDNGDTPPVVRIVEEVFAQFWPEKTRERAILLFRRLHADGRIPTITQTIMMVVEQIDDSTVDVSKLCTEFLVRKTALDIVVADTDPDIAALDLEPEIH